MKTTELIRIFAFMAWTCTALGVSSWGIATSTKPADPLIVGGALVMFGLWFLGGCVESAGAKLSRATAQLAAESRRSRHASMPTDRMHDDELLGVEMPSGVRR